MDHNPTRSPEASTDERAFPSSNAGGEAPGSAEAPLFTPSLVSSSLNETFAPPESHVRRCRHDGWTPDRIAAFIEALAACGVVADACKSVGLSAQSAYAFRNRRAGRAFGLAWDAVLVHRARGRLSDELLSRAMNGCIEAVQDRDGVVTGERHRYDNRLSMAVLTRLDRLAERQAEDDTLLRAMSEDLDDYLECVEGGGDVDAFVEERRPAPPPEPAPGPQAESLQFAGFPGCDYVWKDKGRWWTFFSPPAGFEGKERGVHGNGGFYKRTLSPPEQAAIEAGIAAERAEEREWRDDYFGFEGGERGDLPSPAARKGRRTSRAPANTAKFENAAEPDAAKPRQPSTSST